MRQHKKFTGTISAAGRKVNELRMKGDDVNRFATLHAWHVVPRFVA